MAIPSTVRRLATCSLLAGTLLAAAACDRNVEDYRPGEEPREPDLARIFPGPPGGAEAAGGSQTAAGRAALPPSRAAGSRVEEGSRTGVAAAPAAASPGSPAAASPGSPAAPITGSPAAPITGEITIEPSLVMAQPESGVLFVIARPQGARGGPPLAVLRIPRPAFPLAFTIGPENVMIPTMRFEGPISLSARLDADGNAMTRGPEDISSAVAESLSPGESGVQLVLSERG